MSLKWLLKISNLRKSKTLTCITVFIQIRDAIRLQVILSTSCMFLYFLWLCFLTGSIIYPVNSHQVFSAKPHILHHKSVKGHLTGGTALSIPCLWIPPGITSRLYFEFPDQRKQQGLFCVAQSLGEHWPQQPVPKHLKVGTVCHVRSGDGNCLSLVTQQTGTQSTKGYTAHGRAIR